MYRKIVVPQLLFRIQTLKHLYHIINKSTEKVLSFPCFVDLFFYFHWIGVAKTFFRAEENLVFDMPANIVGTSTNIVSNNGEILGIALRTKKDCKPVFISASNYMSLENAKDLIIRYITDESRIPMPTRLADIETHKLRKIFFAD